MSYNIGLVVLVVVVLVVIVLVEQLTHNPKF